MGERHQELWLIRHGETEWSVAKRHTGRTDLPLTLTGERQAVSVGRFLAGRRFALVLSSPLRRARETCRLAGYGDAASIMDDLCEWDYGVYEGRTTKEVQVEQPGWSIWTTSVTQGESIEQVGGRAQRVIERAFTAEGDVLIFAHAHILRILAACWLDLPPDVGRRLVLRTASVSVLGFEHDTRALIQWNVSPERSQ